MALYERSDKILESLKIDYIFIDNEIIFKIDHPNIEYIKSNIHRIISNANYMLLRTYNDGGYTYKFIKYIVRNIDVDYIPGNIIYNMNFKSSSEIENYLSNALNDLINNYK
jgi:hypothetical protein